MDLLAARPDVSGEVTVEFDEGEFNEAKDMKELGNQNLRDLRVKAGDVVVHLSEIRAEAIGPLLLAEFVDNAWARSRQTQRYPASWGWLKRYPYRTPGIAFGLIAVVVTVLTSPTATEARHVLGLIAIVLLLLFMGWLLYKTNKTAYDTATWAVIRPLTAHEIREADGRKTTVPLWALLVSIAALIITTTFLLLNYFRPTP